MDAVDIDFSGGDTQVFRIGPASVAVPGTLKGLEEAHRLTRLSLALFWEPKERCFYMTAADDPGLAALPRLVPADSGVSLGIVTGQPDQHLLAVLPAVRPKFLMVSLIQFAERFAGPPAALRGVIGVNVHSGAEFAAAWNHLVRR